jgi:hypothetical protein
MPSLDCSRLICNHAVAGRTRPLRQSQEDLGCRLPGHKFGTNNAPFAINAGLSGDCAFVVGIVVGRRLVVYQSAGEALVANAIEEGLPGPFVLLNNVTLPTEDGTTQIDHVLIVTTGIFVIETKH